MREKLTDHFYLDEFACKCGCGGEKQPRIRANLLTLSRQLERVRKKWGKPISVHSGYRCKGHNAKVGGKPNSTHLNGQAADITITGVPPRDIGDYAFNNLALIGGIGVYEPPGDRFCHLDIRPRVSGKVVDNTVRDAIRWYE